MSTSRYIPFVQQPYCCVAACLQMVMYRHDIPLISQEALAYDMGLTVPEEDAGLFAKVRTGEKPASGWGTQIQKPEYDINVVLAKHNIPLSVEIDTSVLTEELLQAKLQAIQDKDGDALLCFDYRVLWGGEPGQGHVCVFDRIDGNDIWIVDPERNVPKNRKTSISHLAKAMNFHGPENTCGIWEIKALISS